MVHGLNIVLHCCHRVWFPIVIHKRTPDLRSPDRFFRIASWNFDRVSQYHASLMVPTPKSSRNSKRFFRMQSPENFPGSFLKLVKRSANEGVVPSHDFLRAVPKVYIRSERRRNSPPETTGDRPPSGVPRDLRERGILVWPFSRVSNLGVRKRVVRPKSVIKFVSESVSIRRACAYISRRFTSVFWRGFFFETQSAFLIGLESAEGYPLAVNDSPKTREIPQNIPYHDVFMGTLPSSRRGKRVTLFGGVPNLHLSFTLHFLDLVGKELPLILAPKNPKDMLKKRRVSPSQQVLFETFQNTGNVNDDCAGNVSRPIVAVTVANVAVVEKVIQEKVIR
ncbi:hypothetical protein TNCV_4837721 [Trichonephila clavipes]|nr:hypothetical protein TNCV_4837721 [Trichonephila clavipes]